MATEKKELVIHKNGQNSPYFVKAENVNLGTRENPEFLTDRLEQMEEDIAEAAQSGGEGGYTPPAGGIPATDLAPAVQTSLGKADTALQEADKNQLQNAINSLQNALNALIGGNVQGAIDTFNEVTAFLNGIDADDPTLANQLLALNNAITALGNSLATVATSGSYNDLSNKPTIPAAQVPADWNASSGVARILNKPTILSQQDVAGMIEDAIDGMPTGDIPTKVSDLENDEGYITAEEVGEIVATTGDIAIVETSDYVDIMIYSPEMSVKLGGNEVSSLAFFSDPTQQESLSLAVSGSHLKANIVATLEGADANKFSISGSPITQSGGATSGTLTVAYTGTTAAGQSANATLKLTSGDLVKTISLHYAYASGPFISVNPASLSFKAATGLTETKTLAISASQLTNDVVVSVPSGSGFQVCATESGTYGDSVTVAKADAEAGKTVYVKYTAGSSAASASLTVASTGATSRTVALSGAVSTISVSKQTMTFSTDQGVAVSDTFTVEGANLNEDISISASGTGFSVSPQTIAHNNGTVASTTVTVTYSPSTAGSHSGSISIQSSGVTKSVSLSGTAAAATTSDENGKFYKDIDGKRLYFQRNKNSNDEFTNNVAVYNADYNTGAVASTKYSGAITIPASVACDGTTYNVTRIAGYAFGGCTALTSLTLPEGLTTIDVNAIRDCTNNSFTSIVFPDSVTSFGRNNLWGCNKLKTIVFGEGMTKITNSCQPQSTSMTSVVFGSNITEVEANVMFKMSDSGVVTIKRTTPPTPSVAFISNSAGTYPCGATLKVPASAVETYKAAQGYGVNTSNGWHMFNPDNIVAIDE